jgi:nicotinic acid mononucleotide adenylyltransferase
MISIQFYCILLYFITKKLLFIFNKWSFILFIAIESNDLRVAKFALNNVYSVVSCILNSLFFFYFREAIKNGESIRYLVQDPVIEYIEANKLYQ